MYVVWLGGRDKGGDLYRNGMASVHHVQETRAAARMEVWLERWRKMERRMSVGR